ncbi:MAG: hypothetical protein Q8N15_07140, partial [Bacillota bacterium]|nr:hypothetical protein [Bacillota bacterium]
YYFGPGIYYASAPAGFPAFQSELIDDQGTAIAVTDGSFTISAEGFYVFHIISYEDPDLSFRVGPLPSSAYTEDPLPE